MRCLVVLLPVVVLIIPLVDLALGRGLDLGLRRQLVADPGLQLFLLLRDDFGDGELGRDFFDLALDLRDEEGNLLLDCLGDEDDGGDWECLDNLRLPLLGFDLCLEEGRFVDSLLELDFGYGDMDGLGLDDADGLGDDLGVCHVLRLAFGLLLVLFPVVIVILVVIAAREGGDEGVPSQESNDEGLHGDEDVQLD